MIKFIVFTLFTLNIFAVDLITLYRNEGINSVQKEIENQLKEKKF